MKKLNSLVGKRFYTNIDNETGLRELEDDLMEIYGCFVKCAYDGVYSHKHEEEQRDNCDYIINYELYEDEQSLINCNGGYDAEVHELFYLKGNGDYIVITETEFQM